jgi:hypothetical protein
MALDKLLPLPPIEAIEYFRQKGFTIGFNWQDVSADQHKTAFTVAKVMQVDLLKTIRDKLDKGIADGVSFRTFLNELQPELAKAGWWGKTEVIDPSTGEVKEIDVTPSRVKKIYDTNLRKAHEEGQWVRIQDTKDMFPYLIYDANNSEHPRLVHSAWDNLVFEVDDPWVQRHFPQREWGCKCRMRQATRRQVERKGLDIREGGDYTFTKDNTGKVKRVPEQYEEFVNKRTGEVSQVPVGVHPAFNAPPSGWYDNLRKTAKEHLRDLPPSLRRAVEQVVIQVDDVPPVVMSDYTVNGLIIPDGGFKTIKQAEAFVKENDLADVADFKGISPVIATGFLQSVVEHIQEFPELRGVLGFVGTTQGFNTEWHRRAVESYVQQLVNAGTDEDKARTFSLRHIKKPKAPGEAWGVSHTSKDLEGVSFNKKFSKDVAALQKDLQYNIKVKYHPIGTGSVKAIIDHELGHRLDRLLGAAKDSDIQQMFQAFIQAFNKSELLSDYASEDITEFIAEAWAEYRNNDTPRETAKSLGDKLLQMYKEFTDARQ